MQYRLLHIGFHQSWFDYQYTYIFYFQFLIWTIIIRTHHIIIIANYSAHNPTQNQHDILGFRGYARWVVFLVIEFAFSMYMWIYIYVSFNHIYTLLTFFTASYFITFCNHIIFFQTESNSTFLCIILFVCFNKITTTNQTTWPYVIEIFIMIIDSSKISIKVICVASHLSFLFNFFDTFVSLTLYKSPPHNYYYKLNTSSIHGWDIHMFFFSYVILAWWS